MIDDAVLFDLIQPFMMLSQLLIYDMPYNSSGIGGAPYWLLLVSLITAGVAAAAGTSLFVYSPPLDSIIVIFILWFTLYGY
jgi:hypothetical protein